MAVPGLTKSVNELSSTIDVEATMIRAEVLFRRYQRLVEAVDKKQNFPAPRPTSQGASEAQGPSKPNQNKPTPNAKDKGKAKEPSQEKVITPELRKLLSCEYEILPRKTVAKKGDGMPEQDT